MKKRLGLWLRTVLNGVPSQRFVLKFRDGRGTVRLVCEAAVVSYINSDENYVDIHYREVGAGRTFQLNREAGDWETFQLRNTMDNIEKMCSKAGFMRVHRQYIINPSRLAKTWKEDGKIMLLMEDGAEIPVSRRHAGEVTALLQASSGQSCNRLPR